MSDAHDALNRAVADEMSALADRLCKLACVLASDPALVTQHMDELQSIDLMTQIQRALADLLRQDDAPADRIARIPVEALAMRLEARIAGERAA
jgi:hypothetical protein